MLRKLLQIISVVNAYVLVFFSLFLVQKYTLGYIPHIKEIILFNKLYLYEIFFAANSLIIILLFIRCRPAKLKW